MTSAKLPIQQALKGRIEALGYVVTTRPGQGQAYPYVVIGVDTEVDVIADKGGGQTENTHTLRVYSDSLTEAKQVAAAISADLTANRLELDGMAVSQWRKDFDSVQVERDEEATVYANILRFRYIVGR